MTDYDAQFGSLLICCFLSIYLFAINTTQTLRYLRSYWGDPWQSKCFVVIIWILEFIHSSLCARAIYGALVTHFDDEDAALVEIYSVVSITGFFSVVITTLVQWYFAFRLYKLSSSPIIPTISATFSFLRLVGYLGGAINRAVHHQQTMAWQWLLFVVGLLAIFSDLLVAVGLGILLWQRRQSEEWASKWVLRVIDRIMVVSIQANILTCTITSVTLILYKVSDGNAWMGISLIACRFYSISFLASLLDGKKRAEEERDLPTIQIQASLTIPLSSHTQSAVDTEQDVPLHVSRTSPSSTTAQTSLV